MLKILGFERYQGMDVSPKLRVLKQLFPKRYYLPIVFNLCQVPRCI